MDRQAYALLAAFHQAATDGSLQAHDVQRLHAFIHYVAAQPVSIGRIVNETVTFLVTRPVRPWHLAVARDLGRRVGQGVHLLQDMPAPR